MTCRPNSKNVYALTFRQVETTASKGTNPLAAAASAAASFADEEPTVTADVKVPAADDGSSKERSTDSGIHGRNSTPEDVRAAFQGLQASVMENAQVCT